MPYVITTTTPEMASTVNPGQPWPRTVSRCAVATPKEARVAIRHAIDLARDDMRGWRDEADAWSKARAFLGINIELGGSIGPLPDGTVIEVELIAAKS